MQSLVSVAVVVFAVFLALWPLAFVAVVVRHSMRRQWRRVGQVALLLPIWSLAASVGLVQVARLTAALEAQRPGASVTAATAIGLALCCGAVAWALLVRSLGNAPSGGEARPAVTGKDPA